MPDGDTSISSHRATSLRCGATAREQGRARAEACACPASTPNMLAWELHAFIHACMRAHDRCASLVECQRLFNKVLVTQHHLAAQLAGLEVVNGSAHARLVRLRHRRGGRASSAAREQAARARTNSACARG